MVRDAREPSKSNPRKKKRAAADPAPLLSYDAEGMRRMPVDSLQSEPTYKVNENRDGSCGQTQQDGMGCTARTAQPGVDERESGTGGRYQENKQ